MPLSFRRFVLLALLCAGLWHSSARADALDFDEDALLELAKAGTVEEMVERIRKEYGVVVLQLPAYGQRQNGNNTGTEWLYHHFQGSRQDQAYFLAAYLPLADDRPDGTILPYYKRPYGEQDLIALRPGSTPGVVLHEFTHFLIEKRRREKAGHSARDSARVRLERVIGPDDGRTDFAEAQRHAHNSEIALREEMRVNQYLLGKRKKLGLDLADTQYLLSAMRTDIASYLDERPRQSLAVLSESDRAKLAAELDRFKAEFRAKNEEFLDRHRQLKTLAGLNARGIYLVPPDFTTVVPQRVLGIHSRGELSDDDINAVYRFWAPEYHPDLNPEGKKQFQNLTNARDALQDPYVLMEQMAEEWGATVFRQWEADLVKQQAEAERALRQARRFVIRFATQCAVTAAACGIDQWMGGEMSVMMRGWPSWLLNGASAFMLLPEDPAHPDPAKAPTEEGLRAGTIRGAVLSVCIKALELLAR